MDINKEREAFENWVTNYWKYPDCARRSPQGDSYTLITTHVYWQAWKARAEIEDSRNMQVEHKKG